jgi:hypothetical protein
MGSACERIRDSPEAAASLRTAVIPRTKTALTTNHPISLSSDMRLPAEFIERFVLQLTFRVEARLAITRKPRRYPETANEIRAHILRCIPPHPLVQSVKQCFSQPPLRELLTTTHRGPGVPESLTCLAHIGEQATVFFALPDAGLSPPNRDAPTHWLFVQVPSV